MDLDRFFIDYKEPDLFIFLTDSCLIIPEKNEIYSLKDIGDFERILSLSGLKGDCGIVLNSRDFIFNFLEFDRLPFNENKKKEIIEWRLEKLFPEKLKNYIHEYINLKNNKVLSILFKKETHDRLNDVFTKNSLNMIDLRNTTLSLLSKISKEKNNVDFLIEVDSSFITMTFFNSREPFFIRKFEIYDENELVDEMKKIINYVKTNSSLSINTYSVYYSCESDKSIVNSIKLIDIELVKTYDFKDLL